MCSINSKKLCGNIDCAVCFTRSFAINDKSKYWSNKNKLNPYQVFKNSKTIIIFNCNCGHEFEGVLNHITTHNAWCPYCCEPSRKLCDSNDCSQCYEKSFASNDKSKYWSQKNILNPRNIFKSTASEYIFDCNCGHEFKSSLNNINGGKWCPYCHSRKLCDKNNCSQCYEKSFASHNRANNWSDKNILSPREVCKNSNELYIFNCECDHEFNASLNNINYGKWCPYCCYPSQTLCNNGECLLCYEKSFISHYRSINWSNKNILTPRDVFKSTADKYIFDCDYGHEFKVSLYSIISGRWCSICRHKTEKKLFEWLKANFGNYIIKHQQKFDWCRKQNKLPFDFFISILNLLIELDGGQHFFQVSIWKSPEDTMNDDVLKMKKALDNNMSMIRILQDDVWNDKNDWQNKLLNAIKKYDSPQIIYIDNGFTYDQHKELIKKI